MIEAKLISPFLDAISLALATSGFKTIAKGRVQLKEKLLPTRDFSFLLSLSGAMRGSVAYSMDLSVALNVASIITRGPVSVLDEHALLAISEFASTVSAKATALLQQAGNNVYITPPTLILGRDVIARISHVRIIAVEINTDAGLIEIIIAIEI